MRTSTRVLLFLFLVWLVAGAIMSFSLTPDMAQAFKQRYKVDPSKVYQIVGACTAAIGVLIQLYFYEHSCRDEVLSLPEPEGCSEIQDEI
jgi:SNF family Na+-dependent transporter